MGKVEIELPWSTLALLLLVSCLPFTILYYATHEYTHHAQQHDMDGQFLLQQQRQQRQSLLQRQQFVKAADTAASVAAAPSMTASTTTHETTKKRKKKHKKTKKKKQHQVSESASLPPLPPASASTDAGGDAATLAPAASSSPRNQTQINISKCDALIRNFNIIPKKFWGTAQGPEKKAWAKLKCDKIVDNTAMVEYTKKMAQQKFGGRSQVSLVLDKDVVIDAVEHRKGNDHTQWIVFCLPTTTRFIKRANKAMATLVDGLVFWKVTFASFLSVTRDELLRDPAVSPYTRDKPQLIFSFYIGYDKGDEVLDNDDAVAEFGRVWDRTIDDAFGDDPVWREHGRARLGLRLHVLNDSYAAPSWGVSHLAHAGYDAGADYLFQCNDDVQLVTLQWARLLISEFDQNAFTVPAVDAVTGAPTGELQTIRPGVSGPKDATNPYLLTQTFVHRTHMEIFESYFPLVFRNWHSDNWLTRVYGKKYTYKKHGVMVKHKTGEVGKRYPVYAVGDKLAAELARGGQTIHKFIKEQEERKVAPPA